MRQIEVSPPAGACQQLVVASRQQTHIWEYGAIPKGGRPAPRAEFILSAVQGGRADAACPAASIQEVCV